MEKFVQLLTQPETAVLFVFIILLVALVPFYQAVFKIGEVNQEIDEVINILSNLGKQKQKDFYNQFNQINSQILKLHGLRHTWREFVNSIYFEDANAPEDRRKVYTSHRPSYYFNRDSVLGKRLNLAQFFAYPNYLIGIGLTFTFIGLAAALHVAQEGLASGAGQQALKDLLAVASIKFISSIAGIFCSLVISALQRVRVRKLQENLNTFCDLIEECTKYRSAEILLNASYHEQYKHSVLFGTMGKSIAEALSNSFADHLSAGIQNGLAPLTQDMRSLAQNFSEGSETALNKMLETFLHELHRNSQNEIQSLMNSVNVLQTSVNQLATSIDSTGKNFESQSQLATDQLNATIQNLSLSFAPIQSNIAQFAELMHGMGGLATKIEQTGHDIHNTASSSKDIADEFRRIMTDMTKPLAGIGNKISELSQALATIEATSKDFKTLGGAVVVAADEFKSSALSIQKSEGAFGQNISALSRATEEASRANVSIEQLSSQFVHALHALKSLDEQFIQSANSLSNALAKLGMAAPDRKLKTGWWKP